VKAFYLTPILLVSALILAACGSTPDGPAAPAVTPPPATAVVEPDPTDVPPEPAAVSAGQSPTAEPPPAAAPDPVRDTQPLDPATWPAAEAGMISIDAGQAFGRISPFVYGTNFDPAMTVPVALLDTANESMGIRFMRFPGGGYGDMNEVLPNQYDAFIKLARKLGAEPHIHVRFWQRTPQDAAEVVRYVNLEQGYGVRYWAIGNEPPYFYPDYTAEQYAAEWRSFAETMLAVDPSISIVGPDLSQFGPAEVARTRGDVAEARAWMRVFLEANGDLVDLVTFHRYPFPLRNGLENATVETLRPVAAEFDQTIPELRAMIRETTGRDIPVGMLEINTDSSRGTGGEASSDSPFAAVWLADVLGRMIRQGVPVVAQYAFQTRDGRGGWGLLNRSNVRPQFYVYQLYRRFGQEQVYAATGLLDVTATAALRDDGALTVMVVNLGDEAAGATLRLAGHPGGMAQVYRIDETNLVDLPAVPDGREVMEPVELVDGGTVTLPPRSATLFVLPIGEE
jgi:hypothetical protein